MLSLPAIFAGRLRLCILGKCVFMSGSGASSGGLSASVMSQLDSAYSRGEASGMSKSDVTQKLVDKGWDMEMLEEYLTKR